MEAEEAGLRDWELVQYDAVGFWLAEKAPIVITAGVCYMQAGIRAKLNGQI